MTQQVRHSRFVNSSRTSELGQHCPDNGLSPVRRQAFIWINAGIYLIRPLGTNFNDIWIKVQIFSLTKIDMEMSAQCRLFCLGLNTLSIISVCAIKLPDDHDFYNTLRPSYAWSWVLWLGHGSDKDLVSVWHQATIWTNPGLCATGQIQRTNLD